MWSGPRNVSTAMMYSWRQRADTTVVDEPLYAHYLVVSGREHPGRRNEVLASQDKRLLADPAGILGAVCERIGLLFDDAMLSWTAGPKPEDGVWAKYWYDGVWASTGWKPHKLKDVELVPSIANALPEVEAAYARLLPYRL